VIPRVTLVACFVAVLCGLFVVPFVKAQTASVTFLNTPSQVTVGSDGTATFNVVAQVSFSAIPEGVAYGPEAHWDTLTVILGYYSNGKMPSSFGGSTTSSPDQCSGSFPSNTVGAPDLSTDCGIIPNCQFTTTAPTCSGTEDLNFHVAISNAQPQESHFEVYTEITFWYPSQVGYYYPIINTAYSDFFVDIVSSSAATTQTYPQYTPPTSTYAAPTSNALQTSTSSWDVVIDLSVLVLGLIACVIGGAIIWYWASKGEKKKEKEKQTKLDQILAQKPVPPPEPVVAAEPPTSVSSHAKVSPDMMFCNQCGVRITRDSKFCKECGAKQE